MNRPYSPLFPAMTGNTNFFGFCGNLYYLGRNAIKTYEKEVNMNSDRNSSEVWSIVLATVLAALSTLADKMFKNRGGGDSNGGDAGCPR